MLFCPEMLAVAQEDVCELTYVGVVNYQEVSVRVRHVDLRILNR